MRALCTGDLHAGAHPNYADDRLGEQEAAWDKALDLADEHGCDVVLFAGDAFEGPLATPEQLDAFIRPIERHDVPVIAISGNGRHDSAMRSTNALAALRHVPGLTIHSTPAVEVVNGVAVVCMPWAPVTRIVASQNGDRGRDDVNEWAADLVVNACRGIRASVASDYPAVLLTHWSISGAVTPDGADVGLFREPVLPWLDLDGCGFDAVVAGHIHKPQALGHDGDRTIGFFVGSPLPHTFGEAKCDHGVWILDVGDEAPDARFVPIESRRFVTLDFRGALTSDDSSLEGHVALGESIGWDPPLTGAIVELRYDATPEQARRTDEAAIKRTLFAAGAHRVYLKREIVRDDRVRVEGLDENLDIASAVGMWLDQNGVDSVLAGRMRERHAAYSAELAGQTGDV